ncbi:uncharacterized protein BCR38DRAFT_214291 [Pseudomassariella vexata]|uniref:Uncharacterized protein n=1 Tax=Pseudomassariella vexata TaxID=1141098 RepID=A0A1Y2E0M2_9PEZI|nr:uncharacterized protein BCR38DRAFT_214291 [Pseudomassariella vexata]ORY64415.1 hypothetical protein BCR38DRAFT_214291 [Pseudomassariella vexata]
MWILKTDLISSVFIPLGIVSKLLSDWPDLQRYPNPSHTSIRQRGLCACLRSIRSQPAQRSVAVKRSVFWLAGVAVPVPEPLEFAPASALRSRWESQAHMDATVVQGRVVHGTRYCWGRFHSPMFEVCFFRVSRKASSDRSECEVQPSLDTRCIDRPVTVAVRCSRTSRVRSFVRVSR